MSSTDIVREVDEDIRREQLEKLWKKYGSWVLGAAVALVAVVGGYKIWESRLLAQSAEAGARFEAAAQQMAEGKTAEATAAFAALAESATPAYQSLARLRLAQAQVAAGKRAEALVNFDTVAGDGAADKILRDFATLQAAQLRLDEADWTEMQNRLNDLVKAESPWRQSARELLGLAAYKAGKLDEAGSQFDQILGDREGNRAGLERAELMRQLIAAATAKPAN